MSAPARPADLVNQFVNSFFRNGFNLLVSLPPLGNVKRLGTTGYVQEFNDAAKTGAKLALATVSPSAPPSGDGTVIGVVQLLGDLYAYYSTVGAGVAGLPLYDTLQCPPIDQTNSCTYDIFDKSYALFAYQPAPAQRAELHHPQRRRQHQHPLLYRMDSPRRHHRPGTSRGRRDRHHGVPRPPRHYRHHRHHAAVRLRRHLLHHVRAQPQHPFHRDAAHLWRVRECHYGPAGSLGLPTTQEIVLSNGDHRQTFEGGVMQYTPGGSGPVIRPPVSSVHSAAFPWAAP